MINIDKEFRDITPPISKADYESLKQGIDLNGCLDTIVIWQGIIIDGYEQYAICLKYDRLFKVDNKHFSSREETLEWIILNQFKRTDLSPYQRGILSLQLESLIVNKMIGNCSLSDEIYKDVRCNIKRSVYVTLGKIAGIGHDTIDRVKMILEKGTEEQNNDLLSLKKTLNKVYREINPEKNRFVKRERVVVPVEQGKAVCKTCGVLKSFSEFGKTKSTCRECLNYLKTDRSSTDREGLRKMNSHVVNGVDMILESMKKTKKPSEEGNNESIYNESVAQLESVVNGFNNDINKFLYMGAMLKGNKDKTVTLKKTIANLKLIINMMGE